MGTPSEEQHPELATDPDVARMSENASVVVFGDRFIVTNVDHATLQRLRDAFATMPYGGTAGIDSRIAWRDTFTDPFVIDLAMIATNLERLSDELSRHATECEQRYRDNLNFRAQRQALRDLLGLGES